MKRITLLIIIFANILTIGYGQKLHDIDSLDNLYPYFTKDYHSYAPESGGYTLTGKIEDGIPANWDAIFHAGSIHYYCVNGDTLTQLCYLHKEGLWVKAAALANVFSLDYMRALDNDDIGAVYIDTAIYLDRIELFEQYLYERPWNERVAYSEARQINNFVYFNAVFSGSANAECEDEIYEFDKLDSCIIEQPKLTSAVYDTKKKKWHIAPGTYKTISLDRKQNIVARTNQDDYYLLDSKGREKSFIHSSMDMVKMVIGESEGGLLTKQISVSYPIGFAREKSTFNSLIYYNLKKIKSYAYYKLIFPCYDLYNMGY